MRRSRRRRPPDGYRGHDAVVTEHALDAGESAVDAFIRSAAPEPFLVFRGVVEGLRDDLDEFDGGGDRP